MNSHFFFEKVKLTLSDSAFQKTHIVKDTDFTRKRILCFNYLTVMLLKRVIKGIHTELSNFLLTLNSSATCTKQSFSKAPICS